MDQYSGRLRPLTEKTTIFRMVVEIEREIPTVDDARVDATARRARVRSRASRARSRVASFVDAVEASSSRRWRNRRGRSRPRREMVEGTRATRREGRGSSASAAAAPVTEENRLKRDTAFLCHMQFKNDLPAVPIDWKMLQTRVDRRAPPCRDLSLYDGLRKRGF